jgi:sulfur-oxidizing protein SoxZ
MNMTDPTRIRANMVGEKVEVRALMAHDMETGLRKDPAGKLIPAHFIRNVAVTHNGRTVMSAQWGTSVSRNPFLHFRFKGGKPGEKVLVSWTDNEGQKRTDEATIAGENKP